MIFISRLHKDGTQSPRMMMIMVLNPAMVVSWPRYGRCAPQSVSMSPSYPPVMHPGTLWRLMLRFQCKHDPSDQNAEKYATVQIQCQLLFLSVKNVLTKVSQNLVAIYCPKCHGALLTVFWPHQGYLRDHQTKVAISSIK